MVAYAIALVMVSGLTAFTAPPGAKAITAVIVGGGIGALMIACAVMSLMIRRNRLVGMIGIHVGLLLPLLALSGPAMRLAPSWEKTRTFNERLETEGAITIVAKGAEDPIRNTAYQTVGIGATAALSGFAFLALLMHRPRVPKEPATVNASPGHTPAPAPAPEPDAGEGAPARDD